MQQLIDAQEPAHLDRAAPVAVQGIWVSRLFSFFGDKEARILVLGLDNAGKTTILCEHDLRQEG